MCSSEDRLGTDLFHSLPPSYLRPSGGSIGERRQSWERGGPRMNGLGCCASSVLSFACSFPFLFSLALLFSGCAGVHFGWMDSTRNIVALPGQQRLFWMPPTASATEPALTDHHVPMGCPPTREATMMEMSCPRWWRWTREWMGAGKDIHDAGDGPSDGWPRGTGIEARHSNADETVRQPTIDHDGRGKRMAAKQKRKKKKEKNKKNK